MHTHTHAPAGASLGRQGGSLGEDEDTGAGGGDEGSSGDDDDFFRPKRKTSEVAAAHDLAAEDGACLPSLRTPSCVGAENMYHLFDHQSLSLLFFVSH